MTKYKSSVKNIVILSFEFVVKFKVVGLCRLPIKIINKIK